MTNSTWLSYAKEGEDVGALDTKVESNCLPNDGLTRYLIVDNVYSTLPESENPSHDRFVQLFTTRISGSDREEIIIYRN